MRRVKGYKRPRHKSNIEYQYLKYDEKKICILLFSSFDETNPHIKIEQ